MESALTEWSQAAVASALGYTSIGFWLFAQAPQVVKNARLKSCEGLSLPFLSNWLLGDITNLLGCILTEQLPFQTYLAIYFCIVDFTLVGQYFYYQPKIPATPRALRAASSQLYTSSPRQSLLHQSLPNGLHAQAPAPRSGRGGAYSHARTKSSSALSPPAQEHALSGSSTSTVRPGAKRQVQSLLPSPVAGPSASTHSSLYRGRARGGDGQYVVTSSDEEVRAVDGSYQAIRDAALDVARAAERAEYRRQQSQSRSRTRKVSRKGQSRIGISGMPGVEEGGTPDVGTPELRDRSAMFDSFHSDMSAMTDASATSASAGASRQQRQIMSMSTPALLVGRGRSMHRAAALAHPSDEDGDEVSGLPSEGGRGVVQMRETRSQDKSRSISLARGSGRRAAGVAFMSLGLLAGWNGSGRGAKTRSTPAGVVLPRTQAVGQSRAALLHPFPIAASTYATLRRHEPRDPHLTHILFDQSASFAKPSPDPRDDEPPDYKRIIGRISAWTCTTLYLTSRLPQIWKNFERKSVEGLSILLFLFAFCGNAFYVASIVYNRPISPDPSESNHYLLEALPYLLGSGGTLVFDMTIMVQAMVYGSSPPVPQTAIERSSFRRPQLRRRLKYISAEEGRLGSAGPNGERQPLLSSSMVMVGSGGTTGGRSADKHPTRRDRSVGADAVLRDEAWKSRPGSTISGLRTVKEPDDSQSEPDEGGG